MSVHLNLEDFNCKVCDFQYFPYKEGQLCPKCGNVPNPFPEGYAELIDGITRSLKINKRKGDIFIPMAWSITSFSDHVQLIVAYAFEALETEEYTDEESHIDKFLLEKVNDASIETRKHLKDIILDVRSHYKLDPYVLEVNEPSWSSTQWKRVLNLFK